MKMKDTQKLLLKRLKEREREIQEELYLIDKLISVENLN